MRLKPFEITVLQHMLQTRVNTEEWEKLFTNYEIVDYKFTGVSYFLEISFGDLYLKSETINFPTVSGQLSNFEVGFLLFVKGRNVTIECHNWGDVDSFPSDIRDLEIVITVERF